MVKSLRNFLKLLTSLLLPKYLILWNGRRDKKRIAITFDDGPNVQYTPQVLRKLKEYNVKATFFLIGAQAQKHKELVATIIQEGHSIGMHSFFHGNLGVLSLKELVSEFTRSREILFNREGIKSKPFRLIFRPPFGVVSFYQLLYCFTNKIVTVLWSVDSLDDEKKSSEHIIANVARHKAQNGDIVLFHDDNIYTVQALAGIIEFYRDKGFEFVSVEDMIV